MYPVSPDFIEALSSSHTAVTRVSAYDSHGYLIPLCEDIPIQGGSVQVSGPPALVRRTCTVDIADFRYMSKLQPFGTQLFIQRGIRFTNGQIEWCPLGFFRIESISDTWPRGTIQLQGVDRSRVMADYPFLHSDQPSKTNTVAGEIQRLLIEGFEMPPTAIYYGGNPPKLVDLSGGDALVTYEDEDTQNPKVWMLGDNRWQACVDLALSVGCEVYFNAKGQPVITKVPTIQDTPVWTVASGDILIKASMETTRAQTYNVIVVNTTEDVDALPVLVRVQDDDPTSPTWVGTYGQVVYKYPKIVPPDKAPAVASALLSRTKSLVREVHFSTVANPALESGDVVTVKYPDDSTENHIVDSFTIPLGVAGQMDVSTRSQAPDLAG